MACSDPSPKSPCIQVCTINEEQVCTGCYRSLEEIAAWSRLTDDQKRVIIRSLEAAN